MPVSHRTPSQPSALLALVCLTVVHRLQPQWLAVSVAQAAASEQISAQRVSRLCSRALPQLEETIAAATRMGRPVNGRSEPDLALQLAIALALLEVATAILAKVALRSAQIRTLVLGAWFRLKQRFPTLTLRRFCEVLALPERTLRAWRRSADAGTAPQNVQRHGEGNPAAPHGSGKKGRTRGLRRRRFGFDVVLPKTQLGADTTDLKAFGVPLKLVAAQDIGARDECLFDSVLVENRETAELVAQVMTDAAANNPGIQAITDQGSTYMAKATAEALEQLEVEHAPQKEGDPTGKATVERAFGTLKWIAEPILGLTNTISDKVPALRFAPLATAAATLLVTALLKAYQAGARAARRADQQRAGVDPEDLARIAQQSREDARAELRSHRLFLTAFHLAHAIKRPLNDFIRAHRRFPLPVLLEAERQFAEQAHRDDIRDRASYFTAIVLRCDEQYRKEQARKRQGARAIRRTERDIAAAEAQQRAWDANPLAAIRAALDGLRHWWIPEKNALLFDGIGPPRGCLIRAITLLTQREGSDIAGHLAHGVFDDFRRHHAKDMSAEEIAALQRLFEDLTPELQLNDRDSVGNSGNPPPTALRRFTSATATGHSQPDLGLRTKAAATQGSQHPGGAVLDSSDGSIPYRRRAAVRRSDGSRSSAPILSPAA